MISAALRVIAFSAVGTAILSGGSVAQDRSDWPDSITVGTASQGGTYFIYGNGWANFVGQELGINARGEVTGGPVQNASLVQSGDVEFGMVTMGPAYEAWTGQSPLMPGLAHDKLRAIFPMFPSAFYLVVLTDNNINTLDDLNGRAVSVGPVQSTSATYWPRIFDALSIQPALQGINISELVNQSRSIQVDAVALAGSVPQADVSQLAMTTDIEVLGFTDDELTTVLDTFAYFTAFRFPGSVYAGASDDIQTVAMWNFAIASADMP